ncbi:MAG: hypothetical protein ACYTHK_04640 [Planctomycetota bacterium]|jgi:hypothetical protein
MAARKKTKKKAKKTARRPARKPARETLCVGSKVKAYIKANGMKCSGDLIEALSNSIHASLDSAIARCQGNKRSTVRPVDL